MSYFMQILVSLSITLAWLIFPLSASALTFQMSADDYFRAGVQQLQRQNYQEAVKDFTDVIDLNPNSAAALSNRCLAYLQLGEYESAILDCTQAVNLNSQNTESYLNRGLANYKQGNYQAAIADYQQVIKLKPIDFRAYYNRALAKSELKDYQEAISDFDTLTVKLRCDGRFLLQRVTLLNRCFQV
ncbi:MAG: tetratricopeptide repeat protein [Phormidium sp.]